jgi:hypothetical protein
LACCGVGADVDADVAACDGLLESRIEADLGEAGATDTDALNIPQLGRWRFSGLGGPGLLPRFPAPVDVTVVVVGAATPAVGRRALPAAVVLALPLLLAIAALLSGAA